MENSQNIVSTIRSPCGDITLIYRSAKEFSKMQKIFGAIGFPRPSENENVLHEISSKSARNNISRVPKIIWIDREQNVLHEELMIRKMFARERNLPDYENQNYPSKIGVLHETQQSVSACNSAILFLGQDPFKKTYLASTINKISEYLGLGLAQKELTCIANRCKLNSRSSRTKKQRASPQKDKKCSLRDQVTSKIDHHHYAELREMTANISNVLLSL